MKSVEIKLHLTDEEAFEFATFLKRAGFSDYRSCATDFVAAHRMLAAGERIREALGRAGYDPS